MESERLAKPRRSTAHQEAGADTAESVASPGRHTGHRAAALQDRVGFTALQRSAGNRAVSNLLALQRDATEDVAHAITNRKHLGNDTYPKLIQDLKIVDTYVRAKVDAHVRRTRREPPDGDELTQSAHGLRLVSENLIESADGKWAEISEMARHTQRGGGRIPIPSRDNRTDADIEYNKGRRRTGIEVKAVNSAEPGRVTSVINTANQQLGNRNLDRGKIVVWIAHQSNRWPGVRDFPRRTNDAQVIADVKTQLASMLLLHTHAIRLEMVRLPLRHKKSAIDLKATRDRNGEWQVSKIGDH